MQAFSIENVSKTFTAYHNNLHRFANWFGLNFKPTHRYQVLNNISFSASRGESIAILGKNGAGKSTLLKLITGTIRPTSGNVTINGRISAMLELGLGFNAELTGRQNVYLAGGLMGYTHKELTQLMQSIAEFADIGEFFDQHLRVYSSGMQARLAFAVATATRPDILIVDEVLSVGDAAFQRKCYARIQQFLNDGTTLLLVSHVTDAVNKLCNRAILLDHGEIVMIDTAKKVTEQYEKLLFGSNKSVTAGADKNPEKISFDASIKLSPLIYGNGLISIDSCEITDTENNLINIIETGAQFIWKYRVTFNEDIRNPVFAMLIKTKEGIEVYGVDSGLIKPINQTFKKNDTINVSFTLNNNLTPGYYFFNCGVRNDLAKTSKDVFLARHVDAAAICVIPKEKLSSIGIANMNAKLDLSIL